MKIQGCDIVPIASRPNDTYWKANNIKISISILVANAALKDQEDKYHHGVDWFMVVDHKELYLRYKKQREEEEGAGGGERVEEEKKRQ
jgi:hypothetical protein